MDNGRPKLTVKVLVHDGPSGDKPCCAREWKGVIKGETEEQRRELYTHISGLQEGAEPVFPTASLQGDDNAFI